MPAVTHSSLRFVPPLLALLVFLAFAAPAQGFVYWSNFESDSIGRATLEGSGVEQSFVGAPDPPTNPVGVTIDNDYVYWVNQAGSAPAGKIGRARLDGSEVETTSSPAATTPPTSR